MPDVNELQKEIKENIFTKFQIDKLPEVDREDAFLRISKIIFQSVLLRTVTSMDPEDVNEYKELLSRDAKINELMDFFMERIPEFKYIIKEETNNLVESIMIQMPKALKEVGEEQKIAALRDKILSL
ncbi:MAG: hypothetical protein NTW98_01225 [Candidatus Nomurabacteria bacterium]|nr:hypothetical protein [Candidatus Nomurabacteria bacterium]